MEWTAPAVLLSVRPFGEGDAVAAAFTAEHGRHLGLARGGTSRRGAATWQPGNLLELRWVGRIADQLGSLTGELIRPTAALAMDEPAALAILNAALAVADAALPEREPHPAAFAALLRVIATLPDPPQARANLVLWEATLLAELGYRLDLTQCAVTGATDTLTHVSPRTGRAVSQTAAAAWQHRLLPLPPFLSHTPNTTPSHADTTHGLTLTAHFLTQWVFNLRNQPLPPSRADLGGRAA